MAELKGLETPTITATQLKTSLSSSSLLSPSSSSTLLKTDKLYMQLNASELSAIILKGSPHSNDRDAGFCSGSSEGGDDCSIDNLRMELSSPTDASEDSVEVKVMPISLIRNKRKSCEPSKVICEEDDKLTDVVLKSPTIESHSHNKALQQSHQQRKPINNNNGPLKKRLLYTTNTDNDIQLATTTTPVTESIATVTRPAMGLVTTTPLTSAEITITAPHTPSSSGRASTNASVAPSPPLALWEPSQMLPHELMPNPAEIFLRHPAVTTLHRLPEQEEPLALVIKKSPTLKNCNTSNHCKSNGNGLTVEEKGSTIEVKRKSVHKTCKSLKSTSLRKRLSSSLTTAVDVMPTTKKGRTNMDEETLCKKSRLDIPAITATASEVKLQHLSQECSSSSSSSSVSLQLSGSGPSTSHKSQQQRNYKNMTRERRIEANARERSRVHTISAAYETLRRSVPSYSSNQKLSKLSVLRVACSYILTLSRMAGYDYSQDNSEPSIGSCFDSVTATIQTEGKLRKKKDE